VCSALIVAWAISTLHGLASRRSAALEPGSEIQVNVNTLTFKGARQVFHRHRQVDGVFPLN